MWKWESELRLKDLFDVWTTDILGSNFSDLDDVDVAETSTMSGSHILI
jgi:hypothetical protein